MGIILIRVSLSKLLCLIPCANSCNLRRRAYITKIFYSVSHVHSLLYYLCRISTCITCEYGFPSLKFHLLFFSSFPSIVYPAFDLSPSSSLSSFAKLLSFYFKLITFPPVSLHPAHKLLSALFLVLYCAGNLITRV